MSQKREKLLNCLDHINKVLEKDTYNSSEYNEIIKTIAEYNTYFEKKLISKYQRRSLSQVNIDDDLGSIKFLFDLNISIYQILPLYAEKLGISFVIPPTILETTQFFFKSYASTNETNIYINKFKQINLPISGFLKRGKIEMNKKYRPNWIMLGFGIVFLIVYCLFAFLMKANNSYKYLLNRGLFALGVALLVISFFDGILKLKITKKTNLIRFSIDATGGIALFLILFYTNPAKPPKFEIEDGQSPKYTSQPSE